MILDFYLISILLLSLGFWLFFLFAIRNIYFVGPGTDNELFVRAAARSDQWKWFSDVHKFDHFKTGTKAFTIILLSVFQKIFRDKTGDRPYVALAGTTVSASAILIYLICSNYWNPPIGFAVAVLFLISFWSWQIAVYGGHINVATMVFLFSIYFLQQTDTATYPEIWLAVSGAFLFLTIYSSSSASKYAPMFFSAVFYEKYSPLLKQKVMTALGKEIILNHSILFNIAIPALFLIIFLTLKLSYRRIITAMYLEKSFPFLNKRLGNRDQFSLEYYIDRARKKLNYYALWGLRFMLFILILVNVLGFDYLISIITGFLFAILLLLSPNILEHLLSYTGFMTGRLSRPHFKLYIEYFTKRGIKESAYYPRGGGWKWIPKILFRFIPGHMILSIFLLAMLLSDFILKNSYPNPVIFMLLLFASLSPILWMEITKGAQLSRTYFPGFIGILLFIGYSLSVLEINQKILWIIFISSGLSIFAWNLWIFVTDIYPARMTILNLVNSLKKRGINKIYTYKTPYNDAFMGAIPLNVLKEFQIDYITTLDEIKETNAWVVIPGTSCKSISVSSNMAVVEGGDYIKDPVLNELINTRKIEKIAVAKFKTVGTSRIWVHEDEVSSYRDLILGDIGEADRFRSHGWLINIDSIHKQAFS